MSRVEKAREFRKRIEASTTVARKYVLATEMSEEEMSELIDLYDEWKIGESLAVGDIRQHNGKLFKVIQAHTTQSEWEPQNVPGLFNTIIPSQTEGGDQIIPDFVQPTGGHDSYKKGDKVVFEGKVYESLIDNNAYSPTAYPAGWKKLD